MATSKKPSKAQANANGTTVVRHKKFADNGLYVVTLASGKTTHIFRDVYQFSYPVWYEATGRGFPIEDGARGFNKEDIVDVIEKRTRRPR